MIQTSNGKKSAFSWWLRTGKLPSVRSSDGVELKFNPWHDPTDGRFTFAGSGRYHGLGDAQPANRRGGPASGIVDRDDSRKRRVASKPGATASRAGYSPQDGKPQNSKMPRNRPAIGGTPAARRGDQPNRAAEFVGGLGEGLYDVAEGTVAGAYSALTTDPRTTVGNAGRAIAATIDRVIAAEDTPAHVQISRAAETVANASARDIGRAAGEVTGNVALAVVPGAALSRVSALRRLRTARHRPTYDPPQIGWVKENLGPDNLAKRYNDAATGARPGQAPTLMRTMPDGSKRPVKFDGIQGDYVIDRKGKVIDAPRARLQLLRQSEVLAQHRLIGIWEVPTPLQKIKALKLLKKMNVTNINVRVVKP